MDEPFVPDDFEVPLGFEGPGFHLEPLGPVHNERDHEAWMSSIEHIRATPGMAGWTWPVPMTLEQNLGDLERHAGEFTERAGFTYSILDGEEVIGCLYIYPGREAEHHANVKSWVRASRSEMDWVVWEAVSQWLGEKWPFRRVAYASRV